jgi:hypothetical protein
MYMATLAGRLWIEGAEPSSLDAVVEQFSALGADDVPVLVPRAEEIGQKRLADNFPVMPFIAEELDEAGKDLEVADLFIVEFVHGATLST